MRRMGEGPLRSQTAPAQHTGTTRQCVGSGNREADHGCVPPRGVSWGAPLVGLRVWSVVSRPDTCCGGAELPGAEEEGTADRWLEVPEMCSFRVLETHVQAQCGGVGKGTLCSWPPVASGGCRKSLAEGGLALFSVLVVTWPTPPPSPVCVCVTAPSAFLSEGHCNDT